MKNGKSWENQKNFLTFKLKIYEKLMTTSRSLKRYFRLGTRRRVQQQTYDRLNKTLENTATIEIESVCSQFI